MFKNESKPLFIFGFPRSGTTVISNSLQTLNRFKCPERKDEGHFTYFFSEVLKKIKAEGINKASIIEDRIYFELFKSKLSKFLNDYWIEVSGVKYGDYWIEKTPDLRQIESITEYSELFKNAKYIFMYRDPLSCIISNIRQWSLSEDMLFSTTQRWVNLMMEWRIQKEVLNGNFIEIYQNHLRENPKKVVDQLSIYLDLTKTEKDKLYSFFSLNEINSSSKTKQTKIGNDTKSIILEIVAEEVSNWEKISNDYKKIYKS
jgi:hypothetical protein